jgi:hypothetical protein
MGEEGGVLLDYNGSQILTLNRMGLHLIKLMRDGIDSRGALLERIVQDTGHNHAAASSDLDEFLEKLSQYLMVRRY